MEYADPEALLKQVDELRGLVLASREDADRLRRLPDPIAQAFVKRNFFRVLLPREHVGGLRGTGSTDYQIDDVFVPNERSFFLFFSERFDDSAVFRMPTTFFGVALAAVALGVARGAIEAFAELAVEKRPVMSASPLSERASAQHDLAKAEAMVESSRDYLMAAFEEMWSVVLSGSAVELPLRAKIRRAQVHAAESAAQAVAILHRAAGGSSLYEHCPIERCFRDVHATLGHVMLGRGILEDAGRVRLGLRAQSPLF